ncbi:hypothetical protein DMENIID0001_136750 [Sergentomyia squamirostris]
MNFKQITFTVLIFGFNLYFTEAAVGRALYDFKLNRVACNDSGLYGKISCGADVITPTLSHIQMSFNTTKEFYPLVKIGFIYGNSKNFLIDVTEDFCAFICEDKKATITSYFWTVLKDASNFAQGCPFREGERYFIKDYALDISNFPAILPTGDYRVDVNLIDRADNSPIALIQVFAYIRRKTIAELLWS